MQQGAFLPHQVDFVSSESSSLDIVALSKQSLSLIHETCNVSTETLSDSADRPRKIYRHAHADESDARFDIATRMAVLECRKYDKVLSKEETYPHCKLAT